MNKTIDVLRVELKEYVKEIFKLATHCSTIIGRLQENNPSWNPQEDTRLVSFSLIREEIQSYIFAELLSKKLVNKKWYENNYLETSLPTNETARKQYMKDRMYFFGNWAKSSLYITFYSFVETSLRIIALNYDNASCDSRGIARLVNNLIDKLSLDIDYKELWKVFGYTRNTIHFGGFHTMPDATVVYKGKTFSFKQNHPINFLHTENFCFILIEILNLLNEITSHNDISSIPQIKHIYSDINFNYIDVE